MTISVFKNIKGQSMVEFTFAMVVIMFLLYGMFMVFRWAGLDLANRRVEQDSSMTTLTTSDPNSELDSDAGSQALPMSAIFRGNVTNAE